MSMSVFDFYTVSLFTCFCVHFYLYCEINLVFNPWLNSFPRRNVCLFFSTRHLENWCR